MRLFAVVQGKMIERSERLLTVVAVRQVEEARGGKVADAMAAWVAGDRLTEAVSL